MTLDTLRARLTRVYHGWWIVAGLFVVLTVSSGFGFYNLSVYMNVLAREHGFAVSEVSLAVSLFFVVGGVAGIGVARLIERYPIRWVMVWGALLAGLALGATGATDSLPLLYLLFTLFGIGNSGVSIIVSTTLVTAWFPGPNRSVALSWASTGLSLGGVMITPASALLLDEFGVAAVMPWFGLAFFAVIAPIALWLVRERPAMPVGGASGAASAVPEWRYADAVRTRFFVLLTAAYVLCMGVQVGGIAHLFNRAEFATGVATAALCVQALTLCSIGGRILGGWVVTKVAIRPFTLFNACVQTAGLVIVGYAATPAQLVLGAAVLGASVGNLLMLQPLWLAEAFGVAVYPRVFSLANALTVAGVALGPLLLGVLYDWRDYTVAYAAAGAISLVALGLMAAAGAAPRNEPAATLSQ